MKKVLSISLSLLILLSQLGLSYATHYCGNKAVGSQLTFGISSLNCGMEKSADSCAKHSSQSTLCKNSCCKNMAVMLSLTELVGDGIFQWNSSWQNSPVHFHMPDHIGHPRELKNWEITNDPPTIKHGIRALYQVFTI